MIGIFVAVVARYMVVSLARFNVRRVGLTVAFDLRQRLYQSLQLTRGRIFRAVQYWRHDDSGGGRHCADSTLESMGTILLIIWSTPPWWVSASCFITPRP